MAAEPAMQRLKSALKRPPPTDSKVTIPVASAHPVSSRPSSRAGSEPPAKKAKHRQHKAIGEANIYEAVAGRKRYARVNPRPAGLDRYLAFPPEEDLFLPKGAPHRDPENDIYTAQQRRLPPDVRLPDSDLLKAVHYQASHFYSALGHELERQKQRRDRKKVEKRDGKGKGKKVVADVDEESGSEWDWDGNEEDGDEEQGGGEVEEQEMITKDHRSMDETALLAFGILLEETAKEVLGENGDMVLTEGVGVDEDGEEFVRGIQDGLSRTRRRRTSIGDDGESASESQEGGPWKEDDLESNSEGGSVRDRKRGRRQSRTPEP